MSYIELVKNGADPTEIQQYLAQGEQLPSPSGFPRTYVMLQRPQLHSKGRTSVRWSEPASSHNLLIGLKRRHDD